MSENQRVLLIAHGHPSVAKGGAEMVAKTLFDEYRRRGMDVTLLARSDAPAHGSTVFSALGNDRELLFHTGMGDFFTFRSAEMRHVWKDFRELLQHLQPTVVHFHHYLHLGLELIHEVRRTLPNAKIVLTLHEYLLLCHNQGQMVKPGSHKLCYRSRPEDCTRCFPERSSSDFFLRERYFKAILSDVDFFIAPSRFLAERYIEWGLSRDRIHFVEYGQPARQLLPPRPLAPGERRGRFAYFGQINPFKGTLLLLDAFRRLGKEDQASVHLDIHGSGVATQTASYQESFHRALGQIEGCADFHGPYDAGELPGLMQDIDWVIIPSLWWENSPVVIEEALGCGRPILCSDIGGMAEKVRDGQDGYHFPVGDAQALSELVSRVSVDANGWNRLASTMQRPPSIRDTAERQLALYREA